MQQAVSIDPILGTALDPDEASMAFRSVTANWGLRSHLSR